MQYFFHVIRCIFLWQFQYKAYYILKTLGKVIALKSNCCRLKGKETKFRKLGVFQQEAQGSPSVPLLMIWSHFYTVLSKQ